MYRLPRILAVVWKMSKVQEKCLVYSFIIVFNAIGVTLIAFFNMQICENKFNQK